MRYAKMLLWFMVSFSTYGQQGDARLEFEVASLKVSPQSDFDRKVTAMSGGPGTDNPLSFRCVNLSLKTLITVAYSMTTFQVVAPTWMDNQMFDVVARVPAGATRQQLGIMLQNLLADRFKLAVHREARNQTRYELVVAGGGPKLKSAADSPAAPNTRPPLPKGRVGRYRPRETMEAFAAYLTSYLGKFVKDATGLTGAYEINLSWVQEDLAGNPENSGGDLTLEHALREQLGLQLRGSRGPVEFLIVEHAERVPTGN